jgi:hypothetical protein
MRFSRRHKVVRLMAAILHGLFLAVLTLALQPHVFDPFEDRLPIKASKLVALADLIPGLHFTAVLNPLRMKAGRHFPWQKFTSLLICKAYPLSIAGKLRFLISVL